MAKFKQVPIVDQHTSKIDEIEALGKMKAAAHAGSYLEALLSDDLTAWATRHIINDALPDIYAAYEYQERERRAAKAELRLERAENERLQAKIDRLERELAEAHEDLEVEDEMQMHREAKLNAQMIYVLAERNLAQALLQHAYMLLGWADKADAPTELELNTLRRQVYEARQAL